MLPGEPVEVRGWECVLEVVGEAVEGSKSGGIGRRGCLGVHTHFPSEVWGGAGAGMR